MSVDLCHSPFEDQNKLFGRRVAKFWNDRWGLREDLDKRRIENIKISEQQAAGRGFRESCRVVL